MCSKLRHPIPSHFFGRPDSDPACDVMSSILLGFKNPLLSVLWPNCNHGAMQQKKVRNYLWITQ